MADLAKSSKASIDATTAMLAPQISGLIAGENIPVMSPCYIKASDGKVYRTSGAAANELARCAGICPRAANATEPVTLFGLGTRFSYSDGLLTPGALYFISATAGLIADAASTGDAVGVFQAVTTEDLRIVRAI